jgi:ribosomal protein L39E
MKEKTPAKEKKVKAAKAEAPKEKVKRKIFGKKEKPAKAPEHKAVKNKTFKPKKMQRAMDEKKAKLAVAGRQTKWTPVWAVMKKYGTGKRIHPSAMTHYRRSWRRNKLNIKPRKMRKWHMG